MEVPKIFWIDIVWVLDNSNKFWAPPMGKVPRKPYLVPFMYTYAVDIEPSNLTLTFCREDFGGWLPGTCRVGVQRITKIGLLCHCWWRAVIRTLWWLIIAKCVLDNAHSFTKFVWNIIYDTWFTGCSYVPNLVSNFQPGAWTVLRCSRCSQCS